ncbi:hypothetical protein Tco_0061646, partial [Tanacetum coccineum]
DDVPTTYSEAVQDSENEKWRITMSEEMHSLQKNQTWYMHNPGKGHWQAMKWILCYIHNTVDVGLVFKHGSSYVFTLEKALVSWKSTLQSTTALLTTKPEYMAMTETVKEAIWLQGLLGELGIKQKFVTMHSDSQSAIHLAKNKVYHARTKHIDVRYHFIREILEEGGV